MILKKSVVTILFLGTLNGALHAQYKAFDPTDTWQNQIDAVQKLIWDLDGNRNDKGFFPSPNADINRVSNRSATKGIDNIQKTILRNGDLNSMQKIKYLRGLKEALNEFAVQFRNKKIKGSMLTQLVDAYEDAMLQDIEGESIEPVLRAKSYEVVAIIEKNFAFQGNVGFNDMEFLLIDKAVEKNPITGLGLLNKHFDKYPRKDSLLSAVAKIDQDALYNWVPGGSKVGRFIVNDASDPLVKMIGQIARTKQGRQYIPFLDNLYRNSITMDEIDKVISNPKAYYSLLVKTNLDYAGREVSGTNVYGRSLLEQKIKEVGEKTYINVVNGLHEKPAATRFASIRNLTPQELYYLIVMNEEVIYTSSFVNGTNDGLYYQIFKNKINGTELIQSVSADHYRKFIKMSANYNTLNHFLNSMKPDDAQLIMKAFVRNLDKAKGKDSLQDAVDVASSYSSISDPQIKNLVLTEVQANRAQAKQERNIKAFRIYDIMNTLFLSMDDQSIDLTKTLGIDPVYSMNLKNLQDSSGRVVIQQFFYGDSDGKMFYPPYVNTFVNMGWKVKDNKYWSEISSPKGTPITIYTNKPLYKVEGDGMDQEAQAQLADYFASNNIEPKIVIHRGHSYHLNSTINQLAPSSKVVLLGSCGGFQSLNEVLEKAPGTQIISTKQTGTGALNISLITSIVQSLQAGKDLDWINMWQTFREKHKGNSQMNDYVPPYQNLGAVFLMAFKGMEEKDQQGTQ